jgi:hypothetical protein
VERGKNDEPANAQFHRTRRKLDLEADLVILVDAPRLCVKIVEEIARSMELMLADALFFGLFTPRDAGQNNLFRELELVNSYSGLSATALPDGIRVRAYVPLEQIQGLVELERILRANEAGRR